MILGLLHSKNAKHYLKAKEALRAISLNLHTKGALIVHGAFDFNSWRNKILCYDDMVKGIMIFDEMVPYARIHRESLEEDLGITDNLYGNFTNRWLDKNNSGVFEESEFPLNYTQDVWVSRWIPCSRNYCNTPWRRFANTMSGYGNAGYSDKLEEFTAKIKSQRNNAMDSCGVIVNTKGKFTGQVSEWQVKMETLHHCFKKVCDPIRGTKTSISANEQTQELFFSKDIGTIYLLGHSHSGQIGDFKSSDAFNLLQRDRGPSVTVVFGCQVGEWNRKVTPFYSGQNFTITGNLLNSFNRSNVRSLVVSGLIQAGTKQDEKIGDKCLFDYMSECDNLGMAVKEWINNGIEYYKNAPNVISRPIALQLACMNLMGDPSVLLK